MKYKKILIVITIILIMLAGVIGINYNNICELHLG
jgi:hypothetical protein